MTMQTKGFGAARKPKDVAPVPSYCIDPQLVPVTLTPRDKAAYASAYSGKDTGRK
jgi:hypothetical protein